MKEKRNSRDTQEVKDIITTITAYKNFICTALREIQALYFVISYHCKNSYYNCITNVREFSKEMFGSINLATARMM